MNTEDKIKAIRAIDSGEDVERLNKHKGLARWENHPKGEEANFYGFEYRIKEQPKTVTVDWWQMPDKTVQIVSDGRKPIWPPFGVHINGGSTEKPREPLLIKTETIQVD